MIDKDLLDILVCPKSHKPLRLAEDPLVAKLNQAVSEKKLRNVGGQAVESTLQGGLVCDDEQLVYPIVDGIPVLLADEAIPLDQVH